MADLFKDIIPSILQTKKNVLEEEKDYRGFMVNKALSFHRDCVLFANEMNQYPGLPGDMQYQFLLRTVRGYKRPFQKWVKKENIAAMDVVKEYYNLSNDKARSVLELLSDEQISEIRKRLNKGGIQPKKK